MNSAIGYSEGAEVPEDKTDFNVQFFVSSYGPPWRACFRIGVQTFHVCERDDKSEAEWFVGCLRTAFQNYATYEINKILDEALDAPHSLIHKLESLKNKPI